jgi:hypothetical protein
MLMAMAIRVLPTLTVESAAVSRAWLDAIPNPQIRERVQTVLLAAAAGAAAGIAIGAVVGAAPVGAAIGAGIGLVAGCVALRR